MSTASKDAEMALPAADTSPGRARLWAGAFAGLAAFVALYAIWPYQHGHYETRISVIKGLYLLVTSPSGREWIFCLFVPAIAALLVYLRRDRLRGVPVAGNNWALALLVLSLTIYWLGYRADTRYLGYASAQIFVAAMIIWLLGWRFMRILFFPWLFLAFTWPFLPLEETLAVPLRHFAASSSTFLLNLFGLDSLRQGTAIISLEDPVAGFNRGDLFKLDVDDPCSGIRSLFSLLMISAFYGYLSLARGWQRLALFAAAIPLAVMGNIVRMLLLAYGCVFFGTEFAVGTESPSTYHELSGIAVFVVALAGMFSISRVLEHWNPAGRKKKKTAVAPVPPRGSIPYWRSATALALASVVLVICFFSPASEGLSAPGVKPVLPSGIGHYWGREIRESSKGEEEQLLSQGVEIHRSIYEAAGKPPVLATLVIGGPEGRTLHRPEVCLPAQGWSTVGSKRISLRLKEGGSLKATLLTLLRDERLPGGDVFSRKAFQLYWYIGHDTTAPTYNTHITQTISDNLFRNISHRWSMVSVFSQMSPQRIEDPLAQVELMLQMQEIAREVFASVDDTGAF